MQLTSILFALVFIVGCGHGQYLDWCTYWHQLGLDYSHPECRKVFQDSQCAGLPNEEFGCTNCQPNCDNRTPVCTMQCDPGCSCKLGYVRNFQNQCVPPTFCPLKDAALPGPCPTVASIGLACYVSRKHECTTNKDCNAKPGFPQPTCCVTNCGNNICFTEASYKMMP
uniref:TIL domain-containing protein n=1 Tax=Plectus sambesii TaxID=2011161 RepID=A0A914UVJ7_9BILA